MKIEFHVFFLTYIVLFQMLTNLEEVFINCSITTNVSVEVPQGQEVEDYYDNRMVWLPKRTVIFTFVQNVADLMTDIFFGHTFSLKWQGHCLLSVKGSRTNYRNTSLQWTNTSKSPEFHVTPFHIEINLMCHLFRLKK